MSSLENTITTPEVLPNNQEKQPGSDPVTRTQPGPNNTRNVVAGATTVNNDPQTSASASAKVSRKRTKTGCLTCRRRRIKCGEERPICANCVKSKRTCEGYNQRVVFKDGMNSVRPVPGAPGAASLPVDRRYHPYPIQPAPPTLQPLQPLAPAPQLPTQPPQLYIRDGQLDHSQSHIRHNYDQQTPSALHSPQRIIDDPHRGLNEQPPQVAQQSNFYPPSVISAFSESSPSTRPPFYQSIYKTRDPVTATSYTPPPTDDYPFNPSTDTINNDRGYHVEGVDGTLGENDIQIPGEMTETTGFDTENTAVLSAFYDFDSWGYTNNDVFHGEALCNTQGDRDEDLLDYSDEEIQMVITPQAAINSLLAATPEPGRGISFRSFLPDAQTLSVYYPTPASSPLTDPITARIFCHFVYVLGPSISIFERHPPNPTMAFTHGSQAPKNVWAYTVPMLALGNPPLLHALLALSSLHIAKLTKGPNHSSLLHYHIALRRLGRSIADERKRGHVAVLAATLVLAYYETMAAEHEKWASHLHGARQLLQEIDFEELSRGVESLEDERALNEQYSEPLMRNQRVMMIRAARRQRDAHVVNEEDENLTNYRMGNRPLRKEMRTGKSKAKTTFSTKDLETCQLQSDLFWWYIKMDLYQALLSGDSPILDYVHWGQCPPRAKIGTLGTTYGSSDHLVLLMGRIADFQSKDMKRKQAVEKMNGGWIPPPELGGPPRGMMATRRGGGRGPPPARSWGGSSAGNMGVSGHTPGMMFPDSRPSHMIANNPDSAPVMYGMVPPEPSIRLPPAFAGISGSESTTIPAGGSDFPSDPTLLEAITLEAELEWNDIYQAFQVFQDSLGQEYKPMSIEYMPVQSTPFGPAIYYRTYPIATLQSLYYTALIILHRIHPSMPAQVMMAAGIAAPKTEQYAILIARITASLVPTDPTAKINPSLGASLIEASIPLFFAGVQYKQKPHRDWLVHKLREITRLTGWASSSKVLLGCLRAWEKMAALGRGPPFERPPPEEEADILLPGMPAHTDIVYYGDVNTEDVMIGGEDPEKNFVLALGAKNRVEFAMGLLGDPDEILPIAAISLDDVR